ncbi:MAG: hypothetical protein EHM34_02160 [Nitrosopumilales archaeon]|nr:MAG: hypothetical protein EHM34_02160 [Nitrosopumilales archaeon]
MGQYLSGLTLTQILAISMNGFRRWARTNWYDTSDTDYNGGGTPVHILWSKQPTADVAGGTYYDIFFTDANNGWTVGYNGSAGVLWKTVNGGTLWTNELDTISEYDIDAINSVFFIDANNGWLACQGGNTYPNGLILRTTNGGSTWLTGSTVELFEFFPTFTSIHFVDTLSGHCVGYTSSNGVVILNTVDGGINWTTGTSATQIEVGRSVHFADALNGWIAGSNSLGDLIVIHTVDGGINWSGQTLPSTDGAFKEIFFVDENVGYVVGYGSVSCLMFKTIDGGTTWTDVTSLPFLGETNESALNDVFFLNALTGWTVGYYYDPDYNDLALILFTEDGGTTWTQQIPAIANGSLEGVNFVDIEHGWAAGIDESTGDIISAILKY